MKILRAEPHFFDIPFTVEQPWMFAGRTQTSFPHVLVRIETEDGLVGWGEAFARNRDTPVVESLREHICPLLVGRDATQIGAIKDNLAQAFHTFGRIGPTHFALSAVDMALWDLLAQRAGLPLHQLLGGARTDSVEVYASLMRYADETLVAGAVERAMRNGYRCVKLHEVDPKVIRAACEAAGRSARIMLDTNCPWTLPQALDAHRQLAGCDLMWVEEPLWPPENLAGLAAFRRQTGRPVAAGENQGSLLDFKHLFEAQAVDIAQPDLAKCGGISEMLKIAALAEAFNVELVPHCASFGPVLLATLHLNAALKGTPLLEHMAVELAVQPYGDAALPRNGRLAVPTAPGLGLALDLDRLEPYRVA